MKARQYRVTRLEVIDARNGDGVLTAGRGPVLRTVPRPTQRGVGLDGVSAAITKPELLRVRGCRKCSTRTPEPKTVLQKTEKPARGGSSEIQSRVLIRPQVQRPSASARAEHTDQTEAGREKWKRGGERVRFPPQGNPVAGRNQLVPWLVRENPLRGARESL